MDLSIITDLEKERDALRAEVERLKTQATHDQCHDLVCNGSRQHPRGVKGHSCSCRGRDTAYLDAEKYKSDLAEAVEVLRDVVEYGHHDTCSSSLVSGLVDKFDCSCPHKNAVALLARLEVRP
jgi:hypothetical protein